MIQQGVKRRQAIDSSEHDLTAYVVSKHPMPIRTAPRHRQWMEAGKRYPYNCLPLVMSNQMGWEILSPVSFSAQWLAWGGQAGIQIDFHGEKSKLITSHFGGGVLTFKPGYLFRTPANHNLWVLGPANRQKDGIQALEGLVEADWLPFTFTMNWIFTRPNHLVTFERDEPICRVLPFPRHYLERFRPQIRAIGDDQELSSKFQDWSEQRGKNAAAHEVGAKVRKEGEYLRGVDKENFYYTQHQTKIELHEFEWQTSPLPKTKLEEKE